MGATIKFSLKSTHIEKQSKYILVRVIFGDNVSIP